jgi:hypothetical protein
MPCYIVEMPNSLGTTTKNHKENQLVVDLDDNTPKLKDLIGSNHSENFGLVHVVGLLALPRLREDKATQQTTSGLFKFTRGNIRPIYGCFVIKGYGKKNYK